MIEVNNLVKKYGNHLALDHISFKIEKGHIYGLLGPNGAGKSTTMNILTGYLAATEGEVIIDGHSIFDEPDLAKKNIGYLPEQPPVYMDFTVFEYLKFAAELKGIKKNERLKNIKEAMEMARVFDVKDRIIKNLSKGYRQRVGLAQAILGFPDIIILDEPTVGLDPKQIIEMRELIRNLGKKHTVILSSHILSEVSEICDYILIISGGKLVASDKASNLSNMKEEKQKVKLVVKCEINRAKEIALKVTEDVKVKSTPQKEYVEVEAFAKEDIREAISIAYMNEKCPIIAMSSNETSLEDVFLELTSGNNTKDNTIKEKKSEKAVESVIDETMEDILEENDENNGKEEE
ncbi:ABC-2 type transport system ATP-binding protein [Acetitomaculum ruminis DSM 5522]|uniref:ABC-2 type transport system ATP-binding protein n=1 Tax=Acetitomaculum ruminis DSM 5522 TaxID=1120918 RepID=A0A1I0Z5V5_9FIRM|nr:ABC transporter ATP-binding protein [Acetitomaculum ruminis]SFB20974.1 ABC-2 type transport system ATP-binding protein [Acetitomaculum ruminis DSM 5522]